MGFVIKQTGNFQNLENFLARMLNDDIYAKLDAFGRQGVAALAGATPVDSGITAESWDYTVNRSIGESSIVWSNSHMADGVPVVILLQYGHGTGTGGYVQGMDFINPALASTFKEIADNVWEAVVAA